ncbi:protein GrpE [Polynucleobacter sp. SHI8]|uniref:nucleotide exchange factor GrpE n=1 Tax=unclassified Polynucleobacter TaxID=2640945 RepID=UPI002491AAD1|nr:MULTISPECIES: nucleotide exchange factor GrpE [unclassified Polynucleobacter]BDW11954.1 protein GrpE [Polynucleobacter sp. SHI2]BDW14401.1 protein GrpE [Polynucleobacter sp. SHI8]
MTQEKNDAPHVEQHVESTDSVAPDNSHEQQLIQLNQLLSESKDAFLRAKAEVENVRRRAADDIAKAHKFAIESFAEHLLPVMDSMHAALQHHNEDLNKLKEGVELTLKQLSGALEKGKIVEINPEVGAKFDPHLHQAISTVESELEANTVVTVLQKGYLIADRVLRPALVMVSQAK